MELQTLKKSDGREKEDNWEVNKIGEEGIVMENKEQLKRYGGAKLENWDLLESKGVKELILKIK